SCLDQDRDDRALWFNKHNEEVRFSVKEAWRVLRTEGVWNMLKVMSRLDDISCVWAQIISGVTIRKANNSIWGNTKTCSWGNGLRLLGLKIKHSCEVLKTDVIWNLPRKAILGDGTRSKDDGLNDGVT
nr:reverse transcriptase zinc-binding domain-containing protein [Tanacetum cinerariifolium]